ncbi:non-ribosomal peptide synthetase [Pseudomonas syringae group genomosp. 3]|uniref:Amino acid adenylation domain-containing protein n=1 Tax=Pseudomonas syringae pv. primulae TaxID=251707 RepID=A0A3M5TKD2_9PSED|nr:non-ribosomal peptide synthetase [Pseudomonas syringae group genomosp. 3]RMO78450.1 Amino acid adenylation domain-containing protein [Pseudomonas syringae pv. primulae]RMU33999.1 hypothetical protein ALP30_200163 [Pseudomonas syringae pv. primulae]
MSIKNIVKSPSLNSRLKVAAKNFPTRIAVQDEYKILTFSDFYSEVESLSERIKSMIVPNDHVAVQLPRGGDYIIAAYAIWHAGGVYLPLDDQWPVSRVEGILERSHAKLLIFKTDDAKHVELKALFAEDHKVEHIKDAPSYVIHTSGTTGEPKGVVISHASLLHLVDNHQVYIYKKYGLLEGAVALNASFCFDSSLERLSLVALGYSVHVISEKVRKSPHDLIAYLKKHDILNVDLVPSHAKVLIHSGLAGQCDALKLVIVGGEAIDSELWSLLVADNRVYINVYGPTENTINTTFCEVVGDTPHIGRPFDGVECILLSENGLLSQLNEPGELLVCGQHLSLGYYNAPELNARSFVEVSGKVYYKTGDLVKSTPQYGLQFLGRIDEQVKVNGYRIELSEVQHHLSLLPNVKYAAVTALKLPSGSGLLASVVFDATAEEGILPKLQILLAEKLPSYMVPDRWQSVDTLPLTENLKLDHKALIKSWKSKSSPDFIRDQIKSFSETEHKVLNVWEKILMRRDLSLDDHFFSSGGDSIAAMNLLVELNNLNLKKVSLGEIFKFPTVRMMANWLDREVARSEEG